MKYLKLYPFFSLFLASAISWSATNSACYQFFIPRSTLHLNIGEGPQTLSVDVRKISKENRNRVLKNLGHLSASEQIVFKAALKLNALVTHKTNFKILYEIFNDGGIFSKNYLLSHPETASEFKAQQENDGMQTPKIEDLLYDASDFTFATVSTSRWRGDDRYGPVSLIIKTSYWENFGWGSEHSGVFYLKQAATARGIPFSPHNLDPSFINQAGQYFKKEIYVIEDFIHVSAAHAIEHLRTLSPDTLKKLVRDITAGTNPNALAEWMSSEKLGYLEGKIAKIRITDIERIEVSRRDVEELKTTLKRLDTAPQIPIIVRETGDKE